MLKNFKANSYNGQYEETKQGLAITGSVSADSEKRISNISGNVVEDGTPILAFNAYRSGESLLYNFNDVRDFTKFVTAVGAIQEAVASVQEEISALE